MFTFGNKRCTTSFPDDGWYQHGDHEYNECVYQSMGWEQACRFVVMRIRKDLAGGRHLNLFGSDDYAYQVFMTNNLLIPHLVIGDYDKRADVENSGYIFWLL